MIIQLTMKTQTTGLVLCALLLSTFGHEFMSRYKLGQGRHHDHELPVCDLPCRIKGTNEVIQPPGTPTTTENGGTGTATTSKPGGSTGTTEKPGGSTGTTSKPGGSTGTTEKPGGSTGTTSKPGGSTGTTEKPGGSTGTTSKPGGSTGTTEKPGGSTGTTSKPGGSTGTTEKPGGSTGTTSKPGGSTGTTEKPGGSTGTTPKQGGTTEPVTSAPTTVRPGDNTTVTTGSDLKLLINSTTNLVGFVNVTGNVAYVLDIDNNLVAVFNGSSGAVIVINLETKEGVYISGKYSRQTWLAVSVSFEIYFSRLLSLEALYKFGLKYGEKFSVTKISVEILVFIHTVLILLGEQGVNVKEAFTVIIQISLRFRVLLTGSLKGGLKVFRTGVVIVRFGLTRVIAVFEGFSQIIVYFKGGINVLIQYGIHIELNVLINAKSSFQVFIYIYYRVSQYIDVKVLLESYSGNFFALFSSISGNSTSGLNGIVTVLAYFVELQHHRTSAEIFIEILIQYFSTSCDDDNMPTAEEFKKELQIFLEFITRSKLTREFKAFIGIINAIIKGDYKVEGIDFVLIIVALTEENSAPLHQLVRILVLIQKVLKLEIAIGILIVKLITLLIQNQIVIIQALIPELTIDTSVHILVYIFRGIKITDLTVLNLYKFLLRLRVIGLIIVTIEGGLGACSHVTLEEIFKRADFLIYARIIVNLLIKVVIQINGPASNPGIAGAGNKTQEREHHEHGNLHHSGQSRHHSLEHHENAKAHERRYHHHVKRHDHGSHHEQARRHDHGSHHGEARHHVHAKYD